MKLIAGWLLAACAATVAFAQGPGAAPNLTAAQIVEKNASARGGADTWRKIQTMAWTGHVESANAPGRNLPFLLEQKRPSSTRFEIAAEGQKAIRIYDGANGWKLRPGSSGIPDLQPYTADELRFARDAQVIDGPLMDDAAKGGAITLGGVDEVEGRKAYTLNVKLPSGASHRVWVDAETFLEVRFDRNLRNPVGQPAVASVFYRNYRAIEGLQMPMTIETGSAMGKAKDKLVIERIALNPELNDRMFAKPNAPFHRRNGVAVDTRGAPPASALRPAPSH
jgi:outer membrane lipoprotein-sorting protein